MQEWLKSGNSPALVYIRDLNTWASVNSETELLSFTDDPKEIAWLSDWVSKSTESEKRAPVVRKAKYDAAAVDRSVEPIIRHPIRAIRSHDIVLPMRQS
jgi:hypothetical protein